MSDPIVYLNGELMPISQAKVSVLDRGFLLGDGIYEVLPIYQRKAFRPEQHMARLFRSLTAVGIGNPYSKTEWLHLLDSVIQAHETDDQLVYIQVTRGVAKRVTPFHPMSCPQFSS